MPKPDESPRAAVRRLRAELSRLMRQATAIRQQLHAIGIAQAIAATRRETRAAE